MRSWVTAASLVSACWCGPAALAQLTAHSDGPVLITPRSARTAESVKPDPLLRIDSSLVLIPVHVTNSIGATVNGLDAGNFRVVEDRVDQTIRTVITEDAPVSVGFLFDASGSMRPKMKKAAEAAASFFRTSNPDDEFFLIEFNDKARLISPFTRDSSEIYEQVAHARPAGRTALVDAISLAIGQMKKAHHLRKALVILSDGGDNWSRRSVREVKSELVESDVQVYAMGIFDADLIAKRPEEEKNGPKLLDELTELTGGKHYPVPALDDLPMISEKIGRELRSQYLLGYYSTNPERDGKYRQVIVKLDAPNARELHTYYRRGYYAPAE
jgi:VWFA-related protein